MCSISLQFCNLIAEQGRVTENSTAIIKDTINFKTQVQPILKANCSPCHFPGGKLYDKLPFDNEVTIISHEKAVLKRFKKEAEINLIRVHCSK